MNPFQVIIWTSFRSLTNPGFILCDELDFIRASEQEDIRHVTERYHGQVRSIYRNCIHSQLPGFINGEHIRRNQKRLASIDVCLWTTTMHLNKIYTTEDIEKAKMSPSFEREYCLKVRG